MFVGSKNIFVHNPGCGGRTIIQSLLEKDYRIVFLLKARNMHKPIRCFFTDDYYGEKVHLTQIGLKDKKLLGNIRNPFDWYYSQYMKNYHQGYEVYGVDPRKVSFKKFVFDLIDKKQRDKLTYTIGDPTDTAFPLFRWLADNDIGLATLHFIYLYCKDSIELLERNSTTCLNSLTVKNFLKCEDLGESKIGRTRINNKKKYNEVYDSELRELVEWKEKPLLKYFEYSF